MDSLTPYFGVSLIIVIGGLAAGILARFGLKLRRLKYNKAELEFATDELAKEVPASSAPLLSDQVQITEAMTQLSDLAENDCNVLGISLSSAVTFVVGEASRHPILFRSKFTSIPLVFGSYVLLLSWDASQITIERILNRSQAYPLNDAWTSCLAAYRRATLLPYRAKGSGSLYFTAEARRSLAIYRQLLAKVGAFFKALEAQGEKAPQVYFDLESLLNEAEYALANDDASTCIARLEAVLSTIHKIILQFAPRGLLSETRPAPLSPQLRLPDTATTVLIVDDVSDVLDYLRRLLTEYGFTVVAARTTSEALKALVEHEFDLVIADLVMYDSEGDNQLDGREVALAAKRGSMRTRVIVFTGFSAMSNLAELVEIGVDAVVSKVDDIPRLIETIEKVLSPLKIPKRLAGKVTEVVPSPAPSTKDWHRG